MSRAASALPSRSAASSVVQTSYTEFSSAPACSLLASNASAVTCTSSNSSATMDCASRRRIGVIVIPAASAGTCIKAVPDGVRTATRNRSADSPSGTRILVPASRKPSRAAGRASSRTASGPHSPPGSSTASVRRLRPAVISGSSDSLNAAFPLRSTAIPATRVLSSGPGSRARPASSARIAAVRMSWPAPPTVSSTATPSQPISAISCQSSVGMAAGG